MRWWWRLFPIPLTFVFYGFEMRGVHPAFDFVALGNEQGIERAAGEKGSLYWPRRLAGVHHFFDAVTEQ